MTGDLQPLPEAAADRNGDIWLAVDRHERLPGWMRVTGGQRRFYAVRNDLNEELGPLRDVTLTAELAPTRTAHVADCDRDVWTRRADGLWVTSRDCWKHGPLTWDELADEYGELHLIAGEPLTEEPA